MSNRSLRLLTPDILLRAYASGIFPMAESATATELHWYDPPIRAIIPLDTFHVPRRLRRTIRNGAYRVTLNSCFKKTMHACAEPAPGRPTTWINQQIIDLYCALNRRGHAHSIEVWRGDDFVGGLYGVSLGLAFFGESMFSRRSDASKVALVYLVALLKSCGFTLLDTQFLTTHLAQFGTLELTRANYHHLLEASVKSTARLAIGSSAEWDYLVGASLQPITHMS